MSPKLQQFQHIQLITNLFLAFSIHFVFFDLLSLSAAYELRNIIKDVLDGVYEALPIDHVEKHPVNISVIQGAFQLERVFNIVAITQTSVLFACLGN